jgi:hypothetical protein
MAWVVAVAEIAKIFPVRTNIQKKMTSVSDQLSLVSFNVPGPLRLESPGYFNG